MLDFPRRALLASVSSLPQLPRLRLLELQASERGSNGQEAEHTAKNMQEVAKTLGKWLKARKTARHPTLETLELPKCFESYIELAVPKLAEHAARTIYRYCQCAYES